MTSDEIKIHISRKKDRFILRAEGPLRANPEPTEHRTLTDALNAAAELHTALANSPMPPNNFSIEITPMALQQFVEAPKNCIGRFARIWHSRYGGETVIGKIIGYEATNYQGDRVDLYEVEYPDRQNGRVPAARIMAFVPDETVDAADG